MPYDPHALQDSLWLIIALPLLGAATCGLFGKWLGRANVHLVAVSAVGGSFLLSAMVFAPLGFPRLFASPGIPMMLALTQDLGNWFSAGNIQVPAALTVDHLSSVLLLVITGVGFLIHVYSTGYMAHDPGYARYFSYLNLFVAMMLTLVMANNLVLMFVGWEGVGLCSYLLIGFWYTDDQKAYAGRKAFVVNRIGDFGFLLGIFALLSIPALGSSLFSVLEQGAARIDLASLIPSGPLAGLSYGAALTLALLLLFVGACGKSAQLPLYVWLPDAMAGPTPVSALIHAATMVTAGVYMVARLSFLFALSPLAMAVVTCVGAATALFAGVIAFAQNDIKKVLAYSTVSQLGFMFIGVGVGAYWAGVFHLVTHAFFKACLFLGAGSVMHAMADETDIRKMGGLARALPSTAFTFLLATIAITGALPISGFFSKDAILHAAHHTEIAGFAWVGPAAYLLGSLAALGTAFYMFRLYFLTFSGTLRTSGHTPHESPASMTLPLWVLAAMSVAALVWALPLMPVRGPEGETLHEPVFLNFMRPVFQQADRVLGHGTAEPAGLLTAYALAWGIALGGLALAFAFYRRGAMERAVAWDRAAPAVIRAPGLAVYALVRNKFYVDEIYDLLIVRPLRFFSFALWRVVDTFAIDTVCVRGVAKLTSFAGWSLRYVQNGDVQRYAAVLAVAAALVLWGLLGHGGTP